MTKTKSNKKLMEELRYIDEWADYMLDESKKYEDLVSSLMRTKPDHGLTLSKMKSVERVCKGLTEMGSLLKDMVQELRKVRGRTNKRETMS